nr:hypothetical protein [Tanacetum cinerariifolium]
MEPLRASWRRIYSIEQKEELHGNNEHAKMARDSRCRIKGEISEICYGLLKLLDEKVLVGTKCSGQSKVVYLTIKDDYYRYLAEVKAGDERRQAAESALNAYKSAQNIADTKLDPIHRARLGVAVNFSVFYYEILNQSERACSVAKQAIDEAMTELTTLGKESDKEDITLITLILRLLNQNLTIWKSDMQMTTLVENNLVFRSFFEKQKLTRPNFIDCKFFLWLLQLTLHGSKDKKEVVVLMLLTMDLDIQRNLAHLGGRNGSEKPKNKPHKAAKGGHGKGKRKMGYAPNNVPFAPKPKTPPPPKKDNLTKDAICHQCGEVRH